MRPGECAFCPVPSRLKAYPLPRLRLDLVAGMTAVAVVIPGAMTYVEYREERCI